VIRSRREICGTNSVQPTRAKRVADLVDKEMSRRQTDKVGTNCSSVTSWQVPASAPKRKVDQLAKIMHTDF
jgi:hypothetical protein